MARHDVAYFREQGQDLAVVMVGASDVYSKGQDAVYRAICVHAWSAGLPSKLAICWMSGGRPQYYGPPDLVRFLSKVPYNQLPWNARLDIN